MHACMHGGVRGTRTLPSNPPGLTAAAAWHCSGGWGREGREGGLLCVGCERIEAYRSVSKRSGTKRQEPSRSATGTIANSWGHPFSWVVLQTMEAPREKRLTKNRGREGQNRSSKQGKRLGGRAAVPQKIR
jgi:hypothetical protein